MDLPERVMAFAVAIAAAVGGIIAAVVKVWRKPSSQAEMIAAAQGALGDAIERLEREVGRMQDRIEALEAENAECRGENRQLWQWADSLEVRLRKAGIPIPARELPRSFIVMEAGQVTVMKPAPRDDDVPPRADEDEH